MEMCRMVAKLASAAAILALAGTASAAAFRIQGTVEASNAPGTLGSPITIAGGTFNQHFLGNNFPPSSSFISIPGFEALAFDSYVAIDSNGPSTSSYTAAGPGGNGSSAHTASGGYFPNATTLDTGAMFTVGGVASSTGTFASLPGVTVNKIFIARLTSASLNATISLGPDGLLAVVRDLPGQPGQRDVQLTFNAFDVGETNGLGFPDLNPASTHQPYFLHAEVSFAGGFKIWDLYIASKIPTPGAAALFGVAGLAAIRRRR